MFIVLNKSTGALATFTNDNWKLRAFAYVGGTNYDGISTAGRGAMNSSAWTGVTDYANETFACSTAQLRLLFHRHHRSSMVDFALHQCRSRSKAGWLYPICPRVPKLHKLCSPG